MDTVEIAIGDNPVSYTHLDVYKRQLLGQIVAAPKVMVSHEKVDFYSQVGQFGQLAQKAGVSLSLIHIYTADS